MSRGAGHNVQCGQQLKPGDAHCPAMCLCLEKGFGFGCRLATQGTLLADAGNSSALNKQASHTSSLISRGRIRCSRTRSSGVNGQRNPLDWVRIWVLLSECVCVSNTQHIVTLCWRKYYINLWVLFFQLERNESFPIWFSGTDWDSVQNQHEQLQILSGHVFYFCRASARVPMDSTMHTNDLFFYDQQALWAGIAIGSSSRQPKCKFTACVCFSK